MRITLWKVTTMTHAITTPKGQLLAEIVARPHPRSLQEPSRCPNCRSIAWFIQEDSWRCCGCRRTVEGLLEKQPTDIDKLFVAESERMYAHYRRIWEKQNP